MKRLIFILSFIFTLQSFAGEQLFLQANSEYANENYTVAISLYDSVLTTGLESSELYYNLGNCHYKTQDWANAIWHYEKSLQLEKKEKTIHNLELANLKIIDRIEALPQLFYKKWWNNLTQLFSTKTWQILALLCIGFVLILRLLNQFTSLKNKLFLRILYPSAVILLSITHNSYVQNFVKKEYNFHNQYLQTFGTIGVFGFLVLIYLLVMPFIAAIKQLDYLVAIFLFIICSSFLTESMLERQAGVAFFAFFYTLLIITNHQSKSS